MDIWLILLNLVVIAGIFLIFVYLWLDKKRFHVERQFRAVRKLFDAWMDSAATIPACAACAEEYRGTGNISRKYAAVAAAAEKAWGSETAEMKAAAEELTVFLGVYHSLAEDYNRLMNSRFTGKIARLLGFKKLPDLKLETEHV